jgi:hypothetical protein
MAIRTVRLDLDSERALAEVRRATGLTASAVLKRGIAAMRDAVRAQTEADPWQIYQRIDLGTGGTSKGRAREAKHVVREVLRRRGR